MSHQQIPAAVRAQAEQPANELRVYQDQYGKVPLDKIDLGRLPVGTVTEKVIYLRNHSDKWPVVNITLNESDEELEVDFPQIVPPLTIRPVRLTFRPSINRREPLSVEHLFSGELWIG